MQADLCRYGFALDNSFFVNTDSPEMQKSRVNVTLVVRKTSRAFGLGFQTDGIVWVLYDRYLDGMKQPVSSTGRLLVKSGHEYIEEEDSLAVIPEEEGEINVAWFTYEFTALAIPMKHVHAPGKRNETMSSKLSRHLCITPDDEMSEDVFIPDETGNGLVNGNTKTAVDPHWDELRKILDND